MIKYLRRPLRRVSRPLYQIANFPLSLLSLSKRTSLFIAILSYVLGISGLWFFFPHLHNAASMVLPVVCLCWLFRYRGLLISLLSAFVAVGLIAHFILRDIVTGQDVVGRTTVGVGIILFIGLTICWLRTAIDLVQTVRQEALTAEQKRALASEGARQLSIAYEQQRKINEMKDQFLLNVSHELRTPLTVLGGCLELLKEFHGHLDSIQATQMLTQALTNQEALVDLVNRVLDTTTIESEIPLPRLEVVCIHQLVREVLACLAPEDIGAYTICVQIPEQTTVWADPRLLNQVLRNLLSNIFKYVPRQTEIHIETIQTMPSFPVCLAIQDAGPGIPAEELPLLFERFVRLKRDLAGTTRGTGLGLYICKRLVEAMKGRIWVESSGLPGEGSRFCLTLPPFIP